MIFTNDWYLHFSLANKQDVDGALDEIDVVERLNLEAIVNEQKCPTLVETCCAVPPPRDSKLRKAYQDPGIQNGFRFVIYLYLWWVVNSCN